MITKGKLAIMTCLFSFTFRWNFVHFPETVNGFQVYMKYAEKILIIGTKLLKFLNFVCDVKTAVFPTRFLTKVHILLIECLYSLADIVFGPSILFDAYSVDFCALYVVLAFNIVLRLRW